MQMTPKSLRLSGRIYRMLLYAYPAKFRREYGRPMAQLFRDEAREAIGDSGAPGLIGFWFLSLIDLIKSALTEHVWELFHMPLEKLERWSGLAAGIGGPLFISTWTSHAFWRFIMFAGLPEGEFLHVLLAETGLVLMAVGLVGLYRKLPAKLRPVNLLTLAISLIGILSMMVGTLDLVTSMPESLFWFGPLPLLLGIASMGIIAVSARALGMFSFAPVALAISAVALVAIAESSPQLAQALLAIYNISWILLGIGLWFAPEDVLDPALS